MALDTTLELKQGTDKQYVFTIQNKAQTLCIDITGWALSWMVKRNKSDADVAAVLTKTTANGGIVISGAFNATPSVNTQVATVIVADTDSTTMTGMYFHELKRTDAGLEADLSEGLFEILTPVHIA